ncbi:MAG: cupin domain-containing protein [Candidatus Latescibacteria bacterium]|nr:cupin domain-containing protein [Candidatus Latescibacterota bacterium]
MGFIHRRKAESAFDWEDVPVEAYTGSGNTTATRRVLIGPREGAENFAIRYFEIPPGGTSTFEQHPHDQGVVIWRGRARLLLGWDLFEVGPGDVVYIAPNEQHQFETISDEPLGFICVIPSKEWLAKMERLTAG